MRSEFKYILSVVVLSLLPLVSQAALRDKGVTDLREGWEFSRDSVAWRAVSIPHDWAHEAGYSRDGAQREFGGYAGGGLGWYRRTVDVKTGDISGKSVFIDFDAVYMNSTVFVNGIKAGFRPYGYISYSYEITSLLRPGTNDVVVRVDNTLEPSARWYHGCGIYGGVRLRAVHPMHFVSDGIFVRTQNVMSENGAEVVVSCETAFPERASVRASVFLDGHRVCPDVTAPAAEQLTFLLPRPFLWSPEEPVLYELRAELLDERGRVCDRKKIHFGVKEASWSASEGFFLNGRQYKIHGVCEHLEGGPVGAAWTEPLLRWKLSLLKSMGCNAVRTAHNPQLPFFYDICDEIGLLVVDEAFDGWKRKAACDYGAQAFDDWWETDLRAMVRRDRNHPCVFIYSVGNETKGPVASSLVRVCREEDTTRPVTSGFANPENMDVWGVNGPSERRGFFSDATLNAYGRPSKASANQGDNAASDGTVTASASGSGWANALGANAPTKVPEGKPFIGTETPHTWQVRGYYRTKTWYRDGAHNAVQQPFEIPSLTDEEIFEYDWISPERRANAKQIFNSSYDNATVRLTVRHNMVFQKHLDWFSGYFRWSGFDYLGEAEYVHGGWPFRAFMGGVLDMAGFPKDHYYLYQSEWAPRTDMVHVLPHWTHPTMKAGTLIPVWAYTTGDSAEIFLNGESLGVCVKGAAWDSLQCSWMVPWTPGVLEAVAYRDGKEIARDVRRTAGEPMDFSVVPEVLSDGTAILTFTQTDAEGTEAPYGDSKVWLSLPSGSRVLAFENGSPVDTSANVGALSSRCFFGLTRAFVAGLPRRAVRALSSGNGSSAALARSGVVAGMICADRSLVTSTSARIVVKGLDKPSISWCLDDGEWKEYDGSPIKVSAGSTLRARVCRGRSSSPVLEMSETFSDGLYWPSLMGAE